MEALRAAIQDLPEGRLDVAALEIASIETPDLDLSHFWGFSDRNRIWNAATASRFGRRAASLLSAG